MVIDEERLRELIIKAIELVKAENEAQKVVLKKKLYVIFTEEWNGTYWSFFEKLNEENKYEVYAVIPERINNKLNLNNLNKFQVCKEIITEKEIDYKKLTEYITVFPIVPRDIVVKTALCIEDTFETKWIFKCMEKGQKIIFCKAGLHKFSGKEPLSYKNKILDYYRTLLEFDIEISDSIVGKENHKESKEVNDSSAKYNNNLMKKAVSANENNVESIKKVITEKEVLNYAENHQIILKDGDIITEMACDKARSLNISIVRI